jgi:serine/threonine-protein kinase
MTAASFTPVQVFISYRSRNPDQALALEFKQALETAGYVPFMAAASIRLGDNWAKRIDDALEQCDYFLVLLSEQSATSEMVTEEVRRAKELRDAHPEGKPHILPIRVNFPMDSPLNYDLRGYLNRIQQGVWDSPADTPRLVAEILSLITSGTAPPPLQTPPTPAAVVPDSPDLPPLPVAEPELQREPGGVVSIKSGLYMERPPVEADCYTEIMQPGALIRIKAPRQMGKTSLMARILHYASEHGYATVPLSFQRADSTLFTDLDQFLRWICQQVCRKLKRRDNLDDYWQGFGSKDKCNAYFEECLLEELDTPLVLALDEVDMVFPHREVADDFFGLLRSWYEAARYGDLGSDLWENLRLIIVHSTEAYVPLNINQSPFNVGKTVELEEFTSKQVQELAHRYSLPWDDAHAQQLMQLIGGHPYLVRKALYHLRRQETTLDNLTATAATESGIYNDHLRRHLYNLQRYPELAEAMRQIVVKQEAVTVSAEPAFKLDSMGLITLQGNEALPRCDVYRHYFREHFR